MYLYICIHIRENNYKSNLGVKQPILLLHRKIL